MLGLVESRRSSTVCGCTARNLSRNLEEEELWRVPCSKERWNGRGHLAVADERCVGDLESDELPRSSGTHGRKRHCI